MAYSLGMTEFLAFVYENMFLELWQPVYENVKVPFQKCWYFEKLLGQLARIKTIDMVFLGFWNMYSV